MFTYHEEKIDSLGQTNLHRNPSTANFFDFEMFNLSKMLSVKDINKAKDKCSFL